MFLKLPLCIIFASAVLTGFTHGATQVSLQLSARYLPLMDPFNGLPDPYVIISYAYGLSEQFETVGRTATYLDTTSPNWTATFDFVFVPATSQRLRFEIWDEDLASDDYMGDVQLFLYEISAVNGTLTKPIQPDGNGNLLITHHQSPQFHHQNPTPIKWQLNLQQNQMTIHSNIKRQLTRKQSCHY